MNKKRFVKLFILLLIISAVVLLLLYFFTKPSLSKDQKTIVELWGYPDQFVITYLPRGEVDNPQLVRSDTWYYFENGEKVAFLAGDILYNEEYSAAETFGQDVPEPTTLKPENYDFFTSFDDLADDFGETNIIPIDIPGFTETDENEPEQYATYLSGQALFIIENGYLTYFQTLGAAEEGLTFPEDDIDEDTSLETGSDSGAGTEQDDNQGPESWLKYENTNFKLSLYYPPDWYLENNDIVLSSYNTGYLELGEELPETRLKCDFNIYNSENLKINNKQKIIDSDYSVYQGNAEEVNYSGGPGLGDSVIFLIEADDWEDVALLCFAYDQSYFDQLKQMFETINFMD